MTVQQTPFGGSLGFRVDVAMIVVLAVLSGGLALELCVWAARMTVMDLMIGFGLLLFLGFQMQQRAGVIRSRREAEAIGGR